MRSLSIAHLSKMVFSIISFFSLLSVGAIQVLECHDESLMIDEAALRDGVSYQVVIGSPRIKQSLTELGVVNYFALSNAANNEREDDRKWEASAIRFDGHQFNSYCYSQINHHDYHMMYHRDWCIEKHFLEGGGYYYLWVGHDHQKNSVLIELFNDQRLRIGSWYLGQCFLKER